VPVGSLVVDTAMSTLPGVMEGSIRRNNGHVPDAVSVTVRNHLPLEASNITLGSSIATDPELKKDERAKVVITTPCFERIRTASFTVSTI